MPHVIVKMWPGKSESQKKKLAEEVTNIHAALWRGVQLRSASRRSRRKIHHAPLSAVLI